MINHYHFARGGCDENVRTMGFPVLIVNIETAVPSVPQKQKETTDLTNKEKNRASVYCLCPKCRAMFFSAKKFFITRVDPYQVEKDDCTFCQTGAGRPHHDNQSMGNPGICRCRYKDYLAG